MDPYYRTRLLHSLALAFFVCVVCPIVWPRYRDNMRLMLFHRGDEKVYEVRDRKGRRRLVTEKELDRWRDP